MAINAPNASHHHTALGIKGEALEKAQLAQPLVSIRQNNFEDGNEITTETDEGHTGVSNLDMGSYRTKAESAPSWEDGLRFGQGYEDYMYLLLAHDTVTANYDSHTGVYQHVFEMPPDTDDELPLATIYHGFSKTLTDGRIFNNAMLNEWELSFSADDKPSVKPTFVSDYNYVNTVNPSRDFLADHLSRTVMAQHTKVFIGDVGATTLEEMTEIACFKEATLTVNNNAESQACHDDKFGENTKLMGARELTGSITMPWTATIDNEENVLTGTRYFETEYEAYDKYGHIVSELITQKQIWYQTIGGNITRTSDSDTLGTGETLLKTIVTNEGTENESTSYIIGTGVPFQSLYKVPVAEVTNVTSTKSGSDAKELTFEFKGIEQPSQSYLIAEFITDLSACHIDDGNVGDKRNARSDYYPTTTNTGISAAIYGNTFEPYASQ